MNLEKELNMFDNMTPEEYIKFREKADEHAEKMLKHLGKTKTIEVLCASMTIITHVLSVSCETKESAYNAMAALFEIGDKMIEEEDMAKKTNWHGYQS
jgi:hypothetical protein